MAAVLLGATPRPMPYPLYVAPAGTRPAGASALHATDAVLPDGRIAAPLGVSAFVGTNPLGLAVSPDGRFAIVGNAAQNPGLGAPPPSSPNVVAGYSLAVVDTRTMTVVSVYHDAALSLFTGLAATSDPADPSQTLVLASDGAHGLVRCFVLGGDGTLVPEQSIAVPGFPDTIALGSGGRVAYVTSNLAGRVTAIDLATRRVLGNEPTGYFPAGVAAANGRLIIANGGLSAYAPLSQPISAPKFAAPSVDPMQSSSLSVVALDPTGAFSAQADVGSVPMDPVPNGVDNVGGARPDAVVARHHGGYAYVTLANVDRVAIVRLDGQARTVSGLDLPFFVTGSFRSPYGTQPSAEALSRDDKRLYVALAGLNAVAVLDAKDPAHLHRLALIPTAWYPSALALSPDGRYLYVTAAKGVDGWGELQRVDLRHLPLEATPALLYNRTQISRKPNDVVPSLHSGKRSSVIDHVFYIAVGDESYDAIFGDLGRGNGDPSYVTDGANTTPNLHALANTYGIADNFYVSDPNLDANLQASLAGAVSLYTQRVLPVNTARLPLDDRGDDPEDYPRAGYLFNALSRAGLSYRDYGGLLTLSGYRAQAPEVVRGRNPRPSPGLGGTYSLDVPALAALDGNVDLNYPGWNPAIGDYVRVSEFVDDMGRLVQNDQEPAFTYLWLPASGAGGMAAADRALGQAVAFLSQTPHWSSTAIFIVGEGVAGPRDHVNRARSYALVVSPLARPGYVGHAHLSVASVVKTEEELLGLPGLSLADLLSTDMADFFGQVPYPTTYQALP